MNLNEYKLLTRGKVGPGGIKCFCCQPMPGLKASRKYCNRVARRKIKVQSRRELLEDGNPRIHEELAYELEFEQFMNSLALQDSKDAEDNWEAEILDFTYRIEEQRLLDIERSLE